MVIKSSTEEDVSCTGLTTLNYHETTKKFLEYCPNLQRYVEKEEPYSDFKHKFFRGLYKKLNYNSEENR